MSGGTIARWPPSFFGSQGAIQTGLAKRVDVVDGLVTYVGEALPSALEADNEWRIRRVTQVLDASQNYDVVIEWADGDNDFDKVWDDRASYSYS